jgi:glycosyltransferase involved in cell wall biosynthesis
VGRPRGGRLAVSYGQRIPPLGEPTNGGLVKFQYLNRVFRNHPWRFNVIYLGSSCMPADVLELVQVARRKGARIVWNQNGVAYPGWHPNWAVVNEVMAEPLRVADHVFYQSAFCQVSADRYLGTPQGRWEVLHNPVDTSVFTPAPAVKDVLDAPVILLGGSQYKLSKLECALRAFALIRKSHARARLLVTGRLKALVGDADLEKVARRLILELGLEDRVEFVGAFSQTEAPALYRRAHVLLHTKYNDPCPMTVLEAMGCGLPVVYSGSGGVPELVGPDAGVAVPAPLDWEHDVPPDPGALAAAVMTVLNHHADYAAAARQRAVEQFDITRWVERHRQVFEQLVGS